MGYMRNCIKYNSPFIIFVTYCIGSIQNSWRGMSCYIFLLVQKLFFFWGIKYLFNDGHAESIDEDMERVYMEESLSGNNLFPSALVVYSSEEVYLGGLEFMYFL